MSSLPLKRKRRALGSRRDILIASLAQLSELIVETSKHDYRLAGLKVEQKRIADRLNAVLDGESVE